MRKIQNFFREGKSIETTLLTYFNISYADYFIVILRIIWLSDIIKNIKGLMITSIIFHVSHTWILLAFWHLL